MTDLFIDVHLMITDPGQYLDEFINAGADLITFHIEAVSKHAGSTCTYSTYS